MASSCLPARMPIHVDDPQNTIASDMDAALYIQRPPSSGSIPLADVVTANENWRGKNDPTERRRIQNRLNQRAFRQRQRAGESPKQYKRRAPSECSTGRASDCSDYSSSAASEDEDDYQEEEPSTYPTSNPYSNGSTNDRPAGVFNPQTGHIWDELGQIINRNFLSAAVANAQRIGVDLNALRAGTLVKTPQSRNPDQIPASLKPLDIQYQMPHDPIIDTIPHARLRYNILRAIATGQVAAATFSLCYRASGALQQLESGSWHRVGVVVWTSSPPELVASWEFSELFLRRWGGMFLEGCEDFIAATNAWRLRRGERLFPDSIA